MVELGKTEIKSCEINNLKANLGVGTFDLNGKLTGTSKVDSGVGAININLIDNFFILSILSLGEIFALYFSTFTSSEYRNDEKFSNV